MSNKSRRPISIDEHREMGKRIKRAQHAILDVLQYSRHFYAKENDKMVRAINNLGLLKSRLEDVMFRDHPYLTNSVGFAVYYGDLDEGSAEGGRDD